MSGDSNGVRWTYRPAREFLPSKCPYCDGEITEEDIENPDSLTANPGFVHWGCLP